MIHVFVTVILALIGANVGLVLWLCAGARYQTWRAKRRPRRRGGYIGPVSRGGTIGRLR